MIPFEDYQEHSINTWSRDELCDLLGITSEDIIRGCEDKVYDLYRETMTDLEDSGDEQETYTDPPW